MVWGSGTPEKEAQGQKPEAARIDVFHENCG